MTRRLSVRLTFISAMTFASSMLVAVDERPPTPEQIQPRQPAVEEVLRPREPLEIPQPVFRPTRRFLEMEYPIIALQPRFSRELTGEDLLNEPHFYVFYRDATRVRQILQFQRYRSLHRIHRFFYTDDDPPLLSRVIVTDSLGTPRSIRHVNYESFENESGSTIKILKRIDHYGVRAHEDLAFLDDPSTFGSPEIRAAWDQAERVEEDDSVVTSDRSYILGDDQYGQIQTPRSALDDPVDEPEAATDRLWREIAEVPIDPMTERRFAYESVGPLEQQGLFFYRDDGVRLRAVATARGREMYRDDFFYNERSQLVRVNRYRGGRLQNYLLRYYSSAGQLVGLERYDAAGREQRVQPSDFLLD